MKAMILNSGTGSRMGALTHSQPKCMITLKNDQTILSRQISQLEEAGIREIIITTGPCVEDLKQHAKNCAHTVGLSFVNNPRYADTNYIYSIYLAREQLDCDLLLLHGDLVFSDDVLRGLLGCEGSAMTVSSTLPLPEKDFKAVLGNGCIKAVGVEFFEAAVTAQPLYKIRRDHWAIWLSEIARFVESGQVGCYAEKAFNQISDQFCLQPYDVKDLLCAEIDTSQDLVQTIRRLSSEPERRCKR